MSIVWQTPPLVEAIQALQDQSPDWARLYDGLTPRQATDASDLLGRAYPRLDQHVGPITMDFTGPWGVWARWPEQHAERAPSAPPPDPEPELEPQPARPTAAKPVTVRKRTEPAPPVEVPSPLDPSSEEHRRFAVWRFRGAERTPLDYAFLASVYVEEVAAGSGATVRLAARVGVSREVCSQALTKSRRLGLLTAPPKPKDQGGVLTDRARQLLAAAEAASPVDDEDDELDPSENDLARPVEYHPTAAQIAEIEEIHRQNAAIVEGMQRDRPAKTAELSANATEVPPSAVSEDMREIARTALAQGWKIGAMGGGHLGWFGPDGQRAITAMTGNLRGNAPANRRGKLKRAGVPGA